MKTIVLILTILIFISNYIFCEEYSGAPAESSLGTSFSMISTGTGHGIGYSMNANVTNGRKSLEVGLIYSERESKIAGADFKIRVFFLDNQYIQKTNKLYTAYIQYNLVYQKGISYSDELVTLGSETYNVETEPGTIATIGHFIGFGNKLRVYKKLYFDASLGLGFYSGSLDKINGPGTWGIHKYNSGFTYSFKIGFGYSFN